MNNTFRKKEYMNDQDIRKHYNQDYVDFYRSKKGEGRIERLLPYFQLNKYDSVLDIGCGNGYLYELIRDHISSYTGIDTSFEFIKECKKIFKSNPATFKNEETGEHLKTHKHNYDKIFLIDVTEHIYNKELLSILSDSRKMLKERGYIFIHTPNSNYFLEILKHRGILRQITGHIAVRNANEYEMLLKDVGFSKVVIFHLSHYNKLLKRLHMLSYLPVIGKFFLPRLLIIGEK